MVCINEMGAATIVRYMSLIIFPAVVNCKLVSSSVSQLNENDVIFYLHTNPNPLEPILLTYQNTNIVNRGKNTKIIIHGFFENSRKDWYTNMTREYLRKGDYNIIHVDWSKPASSSYTISAAHTIGVGRIIGNLIVALHKKHQLPLENVHIIGHSLGAHVSGYAGKEVLKQLGSHIGRITALDAARPLFEGNFVTLEGLTKEDADIVDAIHTDGGVFGRRDPIGTVDFFPNGGIPPQPGCIFNLNHLLPTNYIETAQDVFCSHTKSYHYYIRSISNYSYVGTKCKSWKEFVQKKCNKNITAIMGDNYIHTFENTGTFYLRIK